MQLESIKITDYIKQQTDTGKVSADGNLNVSTTETKKNDGQLRSISFDSSNYGKNAKSENDVTKKLNAAENLGDDLVKDISVLGSSLGAEAIGSSMEDGFDLTESDQKTVVTVVDKIKMQLAKSGHDISTMGGLSDAEIDAMSSSVSEAKAMESELGDSLSDESIKYMIDNELEPTIENIYNATFKAPDASLSGVSTSLSDEEAETIFNEIKDQIPQIINQTNVGLLSKTSAEGVSDDLNIGMSDVENTVNSALLPEEINETVKSMIKLQIPVTADNIDYFCQLENYVKPDSDEVNQAIVDILAEDRPAHDAYLIEGYSMMDQARQIYDEVNSKYGLDNIDSLNLTDVTKRRQLEEVRLEMSVEANFSLLKKGISIDTNNLSDLVDKLKSVEDELIKNQFISISEQDISDEQLNVFVAEYKETETAISDVKTMPVNTIATIPAIEESTLSSLSELSMNSKDVYRRANESYEALMTAPRADMGDSIKKAFQNVDDILEDLNLDINDENRRSVRVLAYNNLSIDENSVTEMKESLETVTRTLKSLTPRVVMEMIKRGDNPMDKSLTELSEEAEDISKETGSDEEGYAKFLWKAEHTEGITEEERNSFIGVYRLINQVEAKDGAAIGALVHQGADVTLRNLMSAVRSGRHSGKEWTVDDNFGGLEQLNVKDLPIDEQIEAVFNINRLKDAKEAMTPVKMTQFKDEDEYMSMTVDHFATAMELPFTVTASENEGTSYQDQELENEYRQLIASQIQESLETDEQVAKILHEFDISDSAANTHAISELLSDRNGVFKKLFGQGDDNEDETVSDQFGLNSEDIDLESVIADIWEDFGEACKTPEEMAKAEHELAERAENAMKNMLVEEDVTYLDIKGMKLVKTQIKAMDTMSKDETYHIPVLVGDEMGNMTLKIVHGKDEKGLVSVAMGTEATGNISASFRYEAGSIDGTIDCDNTTFREELSGQISQIARSMSEEVKLPISVLVQSDDTVNVNGVYDSNYDFEVDKTGQDTVTSDRLYSVARSFIEGLGELFY